MSSDEAFVTEREQLESETNLEVAKEDRLQEESEATGKISQEEVTGLQDSIGGGQILDESEGYTRSSNAEADPLKQEKEVDQAVDSLE